ncbi:MAG: MucB/RseB C-terminal domain-containing protein [Pseudomonadota bacterium]|nr:MucB/RseB C-terminal domain-containing protein [Pseudomonadota bacterium]
MRAAWLLLLLCVASAQAAQPLPQAEAAAWLQKMADASRRMAYEGVFVVRQGDTMQTLSISNRPGNENRYENRLVAMDGNLREVRCSQTGAVTLVSDGSQMKMEKRLNGRHFPDLLPANPAPLTHWYEVRLGEAARVAGLDCRNVNIVPKDAFRWGYILCAEKGSGLPLKAVLVNAGNQPLMQYAFAEIKLGTSGYAMKPLARPAPLSDMPEPARPLETEQIVAKTLPPGYTRIAAVKRHLPNMQSEVEHWVFSDGLTHISLFLSPSNKPVDTVKGESPRGMIHLMRRQVGEFQATVLGDAPWPAVETIAMGLEPRK